MDSARAEEAPAVARVATHLRRMLEAESDVSFAYMFGSFAKGHARSGSDMDIAVFLRDNSGIEGRLSRALALEGELERVVHRRVQIVVLNDAPLDLRRNVLGHGTLLCDRAPAARRAFFVETGRQYYDRAMAAAIFDRYRARRLRDGTFGG